MKHELTIHSRHDASASCTGCGWKYVGTGERSTDEIYAVFRQSHDPIAVSVADVAKLMLEKRSRNEHDGYTGCLVDVLSELYDLETAVTAEIKRQGGLDYEEFLDEVPEAIPGLACSFDYGDDDLCGGDVTSERHQGKDGGLLCDKHWEELIA